MKATAFKWHIVPVADSRKLVYKVDYRCGNIDTNEVEHEFSVIFRQETINELRKYYIRLTPFEQANLILGKWPVLASKDSEGRWYRYRTIDDLIESGSLDMEGEIVEIHFDQPLVTRNGVKFEKVRQFCATVSDDTGTYYLPKYSPDEIKARFMHMYSKSEP